VVDGKSGGDLRRGEAISTSFLFLRFTYYLKGIRFYAKYDQISSIIVVRRHKVVKLYRLRLIFTKDQIGASYTLKFHLSSSLRFISCHISIRIVPEKLDDHL